MMKRNYYNSPPAADAISGETDGTSVGASRGAGTDSATQPKTRASRGKARARNAAKDGGVKALLAEAKALTVGLLDKLRDKFDDLADAAARETMEAVTKALARVARFLRLSDVARLDALPLTVIDPVVATITGTAAAAGTVARDVIDSAKAAINKLAQARRQALKAKVAAAKAAREKAAAAKAKAEKERAAAAAAAKAAKEAAEAAAKLAAKKAATAKQKADAHDAAGGDDLNAELEDGALTGEELASFFVLLVVAGNETTRNAVSHGMKALCDYPDQRAKWAADFEGVAPTAVEEIVRWASPVIFMRRTCTQDTVLGGQEMKEGDKVILWYNSANRDEAVFDEPHRFDVSRTPNEHVGFGGPGPHFCLGANLARREIKVMFERILRRLPDLEITGEPDLLKSNFIHGIKRMPCEFTPGKPGA